MALTTTTGNYIRQYNAFTGLSAEQRSQSGIARAEIVYYNVNDDWPTTGANYNRLYQTGQIELPKDFGYVLTDACVRVDANGVDKLYTEMNSQLRIYPGGILGPQITLNLPAYTSKQDDQGNTAVGSIQAGPYNTNFPTLSGRGSIVYSLEKKPTSIIYPFQANAYTSDPNPASLWEWGVGEQIKGVSTAYDVTSYFRFLQYDIDQSFNYVIQSPQLTR